MVYVYKKSISHIHSDISRINVGITWIKVKIKIKKSFGLQVFYFFRTVEVNEIGPLNLNEKRGGFEIFAIQSKKKV
jgi:hypothetical protein